MAWYDNPGAPGAVKESSGKQGGITNIILIIVAVFLGPAVFAHFMGSYNVFSEHFLNATTPEIGGLKLLFAALAGLILVLILLFTPGKSLKSPLYFIAGQISDTYNTYKGLGSDDPDKKKDVIMQMIALGIYMLAMVATYYLIIKNVVVYDESYAIDASIGLITVLFFGIVIVMFLAFSSYVVGKLQDIDKSTNEESQKQAQKLKFGIILFVGILLTLGVGNGLSSMAAEKMQANDGIISSVLQYLGGERTSLAGDDAQLNVFDR